MQVVNVKHAESAVPPERSAGSAGFSSLLSERRGRQARPGPCPQAWAQRLGRGQPTRPPGHTCSHVLTCQLVFFFSFSR